ncbi:Uncharacterized protein FWK35_00023193 [Aphis craccivora]|uniref:Uncharacterized protein n=1 Tax=Aphis craccivora TaxID=307492 RepID=A0A6G0YEF4_APHCR|nr:Uncharacterized protein FWK35_00023193 [Aphis craccivora]
MNLVVFKSAEKNQRKIKEKLESLRKTSFRHNQFFYMVVIQKLITVNTLNFHQMFMSVPYDSNFYEICRKHENLRRNDNDFKYFISHRYLKIVPVIEIGLRADKSSPFRIKVIFDKLYYILFACFWNNKTKHILSNNKNGFFDKPTHTNSMKCLIGPFLGHHSSINGSKNTCSAKNTLLSSTIPCSLSIGNFHNFPCSSPELWPINSLTRWALSTSLKLRDTSFGWERSIFIPDIRSSN